MKWLEHKRKSNGRVWKVIGGVALVVIAAELITNLRDIKRLVHIHTM
jgi:hypothetical protein